jgi:hypothetical protein
MSGVGRSPRAPQCGFGCWRSAGSGDGGRHSRTYRDDGPAEREGLLTGGEALSSMPLSSSRVTAKRSNWVAGR